MSVKKNDRLELIQQQDRTTGIKYVEIEQKKGGKKIILKVFFHKTNSRSPGLILGELENNDIKIRSMTDVQTPSVEPEDVKWISDTTLSEAEYLKIILPMLPAKYRHDLYELSIINDNMDHYYNNTTFSFQANV